MAAHSNTNRPTAGRSFTPPAPARGRCGAGIGRCPLAARARANVQCGEPAVEALALLDEVVLVHEVLQREVATVEDALDRRRLREARHAPKHGCLRGGDSLGQLEGGGGAAANAARAVAATALPGKKKKKKRREVISRSKPSNSIPIIKTHAARRLCRSTFMCTVRLSYPRAIYRWPARGRAAVPLPPSQTARQRSAARARAVALLLQAIARRSRLAGAHLRACVLVQNIISGARPCPLTRCATSTG